MVAKAKRSILFPATLAIYNYPLHHSSFVVRRSSFVVIRRSFGVRSSFVVIRRSFGVRSSFVVIRRSFGVKTLYIHTLYVFQPQTTGCCHASTLNHPAMFSSFYKKAERLILVVLDLSCSMEAYKKHVYASCLELEKFYGDGKTGSAVYFIAFAGLGEMASSERVNDVMHINGGTSIAQAFQSAINVINVKHIRMNFKKVSLVFVSDGEDNQPDQCRRAIAALQGKLPHGVECEIHCIGCFGFPTDFAAGPLFAIFGKSNRRTVAPVLACPEPIDFPHVFSVLRKMLESSEDPPVPTAEDLASLADPQAMVEVARRVYNAAVNASMYFKDTPELQAFEDCVEKLGRVQAMHKAYVRQTKTSPASALFSNSIRQVETKSNGLVLENLYRQAKKCLDMVKTGQKISHLSDQAKLDIAGMAGNLKMLKKVSKYHMPDEARVIASLVGFLEEYPTDPALPPARYDGLVETEEKVSLYEVFADAKSVLTSITSEKLSAEELLAHLPLIGYSLKIAKLPSGASMNPWLVHVEGMSFSPSTMQELLSDPGAYNGMLLVPSQVPHKDATWFKYCQSCILYTDFEAASQFNSAIFQNEAWWALLAACVKHWLLEPSLWNSVAFGPTQLSICDGFRSLFTCVHPHATGYIELMKNDFQFRDCLVAEHPSLEKFVTCPHLTKPLFAMWYYMSSLNDPEKVPFDDRKFRRRYIGFLVEFFHRAGVQRIKWTDLVCVKPVKEILDEEIGGLIDKCYEHGCTLPKALHALWPSVRASLDAVRLKVKENPGNYVELPRINLEALDDLENHHFTFGSIVSAFIGLAGCLRYGLESGSDGETIVKLTELELARILLVAQNRDNLLRNRDPLFDTPLSLKEFQDMAYKHGVDRYMDLLYAEANVRFVERYRQEQRTHHLATPTCLDVRALEAWQADRGYDAQAYLNVDPYTGLARNVCACPSCFYYMKDLGGKHAGDKISSSVLGHLEGIPEIPGLHKAIAKYPRVPNEEERDYVKRIVRLLREGAPMNLVHPRADMIERHMEILQTDAKFAGVYGAYARDRIAKLKETLDSYVENALEKFKTDFPDDAEVECAVLQVLSAKTLDNVQTFEFLDGMKNRFALMKMED